MTERLTARERARARKLDRIKAGDTSLEVAAYLPDPDADLDLDECFGLVNRFLTVRDGRLGELAAPVSLLPGEPDRIATAIDRMAGLPPSAEETSQDQLDHYQMLVAALIDLQAFVPDDDARTVRHWDVNRGSGGSADAEAQTAAVVISRIRAGQAAAVKWVRDDPSVIGNVNALRDLEVRIGDSRQALRAVAAYRDGQTGGFTMMFIWPISAGVGAIVGTFVFGPSLVAYAALAAAWLVAPAYGWAVGAVSSAIDQAALTAGHAIVILRMLSTIVGAVLLFGSPGLIAIALLAIAGAIGLP